MEEFFNKSLLLIDKNKDEYRYFTFFIIIILFVTLFSGCNGNKNLSIIPTENMAEPMSGHTATLLNNGKVLITGGTRTASSELYNPQTGQFTRTGKEIYKRNMNTTTLLKDGRVLITGGFTATGPDGADPIASSEIYDSSKSRFLLSGKMQNPRAFHSATLLLNGNVLITGGIDNKGNTDTAELYDPSINYFKLTSNMNTRRQSHGSVLLNDGRVLIVGGSNGKYIKEAELYYPETGKFLPIGKTNYNYFFPTLKVLSNNKVLITDGGRIGELYDPINNKFTKVTGIYLTRVYPFIFQLNNEQLLMIGKTNFPVGFGFEQNAGIYNLKTQNFTKLNDLIDGRRSFSATLLKNNKILIAGGSFDKKNTNSAYLIDLKNLTKRSN